MTTKGRATYEVYLPNPRGVGPVTVIRTVGRGRSAQRFEYKLSARGVLTFPEAAALLGKTRVTLYNWTRANPPKIKTRKVGGRWVIPVSEVKRVLGESRKDRAEPSAGRVAPKYGGEVFGSNPRVITTDPKTGKSVELVCDDAVLEGTPDGAVAIWSPSGPLRWRQRKPPTRVKGAKFLGAMGREGGEKDGSQDQS
jgi:predicted DNA-binding transcriptional regulator AlpA